MPSATISPGTRRRSGEFLRPCITVFDGTDQVKVFLDSILYLESTHDSNAHSNTQIITSSCRITARKSLSEVEKLVGENFLKLHRGLIVNMDFIQRMDMDRCVLKKRGGGGPLQKRAARSGNGTRAISATGSRIWERNDDMNGIFLQWLGFLVLIAPFAFLRCIPFDAAAFRFGMPAAWGGMAALLGVFFHRILREYFSETLSEDVNRHLPFFASVTFLYLAATIVVGVNDHYENALPPLPADAVRVLHPLRPGGVPLSLP